MGTFEVCTQAVTCHNSDYEMIIISSSSSSSLLCAMYKHTNICIFVGD